MSGAFTRRPWAEFASIHGTARQPVALDALVMLRDYRREERLNAGGEDPLEIIVAYAQDTLLYDAQNRIYAADASRYAAAKDEDKVNKFHQAYRADAPLLLHRKLADIVVDAAIDLHRRHGFSLRVYDGLRTVEAAFLLYNNADPTWLGYDANGEKTLPALLAAPGYSAHNRALAVDSSLVDAEGCEFERFDHLDMNVNHRDYAGDAISARQKEARLIRERAFQRAALARGTLIAPLLAEYWDDRMPGEEADVWRVMASIRRCLSLGPAESKAMQYDQFAQQWAQLPQKQLAELFGEQALQPPAPEHILYHEALNPIYDRDLPEAMRLAVTSPDGFSIR